MRHATLFSLVWLIPAAPSVAAKEPTLSGTVRFEGKPVADATITLVPIQARDQRENSPRSESTTGPDGSFKLPIPQSTDFWRAVLARDRQGRIGWTNLIYGVDLTEEPPVTIELLPAGNVAGRIVDGQGTPIANADVRIEAVDTWWYLSAKQSADSKTVTAADGTFKLAGLPADLGVRIAVDAGEKGRCSAIFDATQPIEIKLEQPGSLKLSFAGLNDETLLVGYTFTLTRRHVKSPLANELECRYVIANVVGNTHVLKGVVPGTYGLTMTIKSAGPHIPVIPQEIVVASGQETVVSIPLAKAVEVSGKLIDATTKKPITRGSVHVNIGGSSEARSTSVAVTTGEDGRYHGYALPGTTASVSAFASGYEYAVVRLPELKPGQVGTLADIALRPTPVVRGIVHDENGKPVADAVIHRAKHPGSMDGTRNPVSDDNGAFTLNKLQRDQRYSLFARTATAVNNGGTQVDFTDQEMLRLEISEKHAFRFKGNIVDRAGKPIAAAHVRVLIQWRERNSSWTGSLETHVADSEGRFLSNVLWPKEDYHVEVTRDGYDKWTSAKIAGAAGQVHDFGKIALIKIDGQVAGKVVDSAGKPLAGVEVFNQGDAPKRVATFSDEQGRFHLRGLYEGDIYVFAVKDGYRFMAKKLAGSSADETLVLLRADEAVPPRKLVGPTPEEIAERPQMAKRLLERIWSLPENLTSGNESRIIEQMRKIDPILAAKWLAEKRHLKRADSEDRQRQVRREQLERAEKIADTDADEALALIRAEWDSEQFHTLQKLARKFGKSDPAKAWRFLEEATAGAREGEGHAQAWALAVAGDTAIQLGHSAAGNKLILEAAALAEKCGGAGFHGFARGRAAQALAPFDLVRARKLIESITEPNERCRWLQSAAAGIVADQPERAFELLENDRTANTFGRIALVLRLAETNPELAVRKAAGIDGANWRIETYAEIAVKLAAKDRPQAHALLDRAMSELSAKPRSKKQNGSEVYHAGIAGAWVAYRAMSIGHPDVPGLLDRALALRPTADMRFDRTDELTKMAAIVTLIDATTAREIYARGSKDYLPNFRYANAYNWWSALAVVDPKRAEALATQRLDALKEPSQFHSTGAQEVILMLLAKPEDRLGLLRIYPGHRAELED